MDVAPPDTSLVEGWLPVVLQAIAAAALLVVLVRRGRRWWTIRVPVAAVVGVAGALLTRWVAVSEGAANDPAPTSLWAWAGLTAAALALAVTGWPGVGWWRRTVAVLAVPLALLSTGVVLNQWVGYLPTVSSAWAQASGAALPDEVDPDALGGPEATPPAHGAVVPVSVPSTASGFVHRQEYVYLPPAWFVAQDRSRLPVVMLLGAEYSVATDWIRTGNAVAAADRYAAAHHGLAPVLVLPDASGSFDNDTECVNGTRGRVADHLTRDVRPYVLAHFGLSADPARWAVAGFSTGGTCALDLAVMHPELFGTFDDIAGDAAPNVGTKDQTISRLFAGDAAAYDAFDPTVVLTRHGRYPHLTGRFDETTGRTATGAAVPVTQRDAAYRLCALAGRDGVRCTVVLAPGGHNWQFGAAAFARALPWLTDQLAPPPAAPHS